MLKNIVKYEKTICSIICRKVSNIAIADKSSNKEIPTQLYSEKTSINELSSDLCSEDLNDIATYLKPTFNFASYINKSVTLQQFFKLGVELHKLEKNQEVVKFLLTLNFEQDVQKYVDFLENLNISADDIGKIITKNPFILKEDVEDLRVRVNYLLCKKFTSDMITNIVTKNPYWLSYSTQDIDKMLGFFQQNFNLTGNEVRTVAVSCPKLITYKQKTIKVNTFALHEEMGFDLDDLKTLLLQKPRLFMREQRSVLNTFEYLSQEMKISHGQIMDEPGILTCRVNRLKERHTFLEKLGRAQYDPKKPKYVSLNALVSASDSYFSTEIAKSSIQTFNVFLKSI